MGDGTRLTLGAQDRPPLHLGGAVGWHICFAVLDYLLSGTPVSRIAGGEAMKFGGWRRLNAEYAKQFGVEVPKMATASGSIIPIMVLSGLWMWKGHVVRRLVSGRPPASD